MKNLLSSILIMRQFTAADRIRDLEYLTDASAVVLGLRMDKDLNSLVIPDMLINRAKSASELFWTIKETSDVKIPIILTGGDPAQLGITEAEIMHGLLTDSLPKSIVTKAMTWPIRAQAKILRSIPCENLIIEKESLNTVQNAQYSLKLTQNRKLVLVSSEFHLPRARALFDYILNRQDVDNKVEVLVSPVLESDPEKISQVRQKSGLSFDEIPTNNTFLDTNSFNNLERVYWERMILRKQGETWENYQDLRDQAVKELSMIEEMFRNRWPDQVLSP